jgi:shikimate kinase
LSKTPVQNIALIGFMAVGKSAIGRNLAKRLHRRFVDLDALIEKTEGIKVREIFAQKGENYFRQLEKRVLDDVLRREGQVIATGGGVVMDDENLHWLHARALLVGLTASIDILLTRAGTGAKRPLLQGVNRKERIETLLKEREPRYAQAHVIIDTSDLVIDQVVGKIVEALGLEKEPHADSNRQS